MPHFSDNMLSESPHSIPSTKASHAFPDAGLPSAKLPGVIYLLSAPYSAKPISAGLTVNDFMLTSDYLLII
jgi:hypothetical protein